MAGGLPAQQSPKLAAADLVVVGRAGVVHHIKGVRRQEERRRPPARQDVVAVETMDEKRERERLEEEPKLRLYSSLVARSGTAVSPSRCITPLSREEVGKG